MNRHENETPEERAQRLAWLKMGHDNGLLVTATGEEIAASMLCDPLLRYINAASSLSPLLRPRTPMEILRALEQMDARGFLSEDEEGGSNAPRS